MITIISQISISALILISSLLVVTVPVIFASSNGWNENKNYIILGATAWTTLVLFIGILNFFIV